MTRANGQSSPYLYEGDFLRLLLILGVIFTHTETTFTNATTPGSVSHLIFNATHVMLHFTRMGFVFVTGLVLTWQYFDRHPNWWHFWVKRYRRIGIPYLVWITGLLAGLMMIQHGQLLGIHYWQRWVTTVTNGSGFYMYYLFMIAQLYLVFPILLWFVEKTRRYHWWVVGLSLVLQLTLLVVIKYVQPTTTTHPVWSLILTHYGTDPLVYQLYFVLGAVTAVHYQTVAGWLQRHLRLLVSVAVMMSVATIGLYWFNRDVLLRTNHQAQSIHQPFVALMDICVIMALLGVSQWLVQQHRWSLTRVHGTGQLVFGVYLTQSIFLTAMAGLLRLTNWPSWLYLGLMPLGFVVVMTATWQFVKMLSRYRWTRPLIGLQLDSENKMIKSY